MFALSFSAVFLSELSPRYLHKIPVSHFCFLCFLIFPLSPCSFHPFSTVCTDLFHIYVEKAEIYSVSTVYLINFPPFLPWKCAL